MTYSLMLSGGDLSTASSMLQTVSGTEKLKQDIHAWLTEAYQIDRFHPKYGSLMTSYIGQPMNVDSVFAIQVEVARVLSNLQSYQKQMYQQDPTLYSPDELLDYVDDISTVFDQDRLRIGITFRTATGYAAYTETVVS